MQFVTGFNGFSWPGEKARSMEQGAWSWEQMAGRARISNSARRATKRHEKAREGLNRQGRQDATAGRGQPTCSSSIAKIPKGFHNSAQVADSPVESPRSAVARSCVCRRTPSRACSFILRRWIEPRIQGTSVPNVNSHRSQRYERVQNVTEILRGKRVD